MLFFSTSDGFKTPHDDQVEDTNENEEQNGTMSGVVGGFKIGSFLGRGGFGEVRTGIHQLTGEIVALKFILVSNQEEEC